MADAIQGLWRIRDDIQQPALTRDYVLDGHMYMIAHDTGNISMVPLTTIKFVKTRPIVVIKSDDEQIYNLYEDGYTWSYNYDYHPYVEPDDNNYDQSRLVYVNTTFAELEASTSTTQANIFVRLFSQSADMVESYTYTVKSYDGATDLASVSAYPTVSAELTAVGNTRVLALTDADGTVTSTSWTTSDPPGTTFLGLAYSANATEADIPVDEVTTVSWEADTTLYEVYTDLYDNRCTIRTWNGSEALTALANLPDIRSARITATGRARVLTLTDHTGAQYTLSWTTPKPRGATLLGLAYEPDATSSDIPTDLGVEVGWTGDRTLYEVYADLYDNVYTVKSSNGLKTLATLSDAPGMVSAQLLTVNDTKTLILTGDNGASYSMSWTSEAPEDKTFYGLGFRAGEWDPELVTGSSITVDWSEDFTLYEVYRTYKPPSTPFDINLYKSTAEPNRVDKTDYLTSYGTLSGALRNECSIVRPSITFKYEGVPLFNYVYIAKFKRYYFVTAMTSVSKDLWRMDLNCDVLYSFKDEIGALWAIIARQEHDYSLMLNDPEILATNERTFTVVEGGTPINLTQATISYVLTVVGRGGV